MKQVSKAIDSTNGRHTISPIYPFRDYISTSVTPDFHFEYGEHGQIGEFGAVFPCKHGRLLDFYALETTLLENIEEKNRKIKYSG